jgi:hypothetical protein
MIIERLIVVLNDFRNDTQPFTKVTLAHTFFDTTPAAASLSITSPPTFSHHTNFILTNFDRKLSVTAALTKANLLT